MKQFRVQPINSNKVWNANARYRVNEVVTYNGVAYQNISGKNVEPGTTDDWLLVKDEGTSFPTLEQVTDVGNTTTNGIIVYDNTLMVADTDNFSETRIGQGYIDIKNGNTFKGTIRANDLDSNKTYELSNKQSGTIALEEQTIPITGTEDGNSVIGTIDFNIDDNYLFKGKIGADVVSQLYVSSGDNEVFLELKSPTDLSINTKYTQSSINFSNSLGATRILNGNDNVTIENSNIYYKGLSGSQDFSPNITDLDYTQKIYVDRPKIRTINSSDNLVLSDKTLNISSGTFTVGIVTAVGNSGVTFEIMNNGSGIVTLDPNSTETINGKSTLIVASETGVIIKSDGSNWLIIGKTRLETLNRTQWIQSISTTTIANGASLNLFTLVTDANKLINGTDGGIYELSIATDKILTNWHGDVMTHHIRISSTIVTGSDQHYLLTLRRYSDNSIIGQVQLNRNADTGLFTADFLTYTYSNVDPFVTGGFYIQLDNNSGASVDISGNINLLIVTYFK